MKPLVVAEDAGEGLTELNWDGVVHPSARKRYYLGGIKASVLEKLGIGQVYGLPHWRLGAPESADVFLQTGFHRKHA